jgi:hypothetical protein
MSKSLNEILQSVPLRTSTTAHQYAKQLTTQQGHALAPHHVTSIHHPKNDFLQSRQSTRHNSSSLSVHANYHSHPKIASALLSVHEYDKQATRQSEREAAERSHLHALNLQKVGYVKRAVFIDKEAIRWSCGIYSQTATKALKSPLFAQTPTKTSPETTPFAAMKTTFHTSQCIMLVCETAIVFHDVQSKRSSAITTVDFGASKATPSCAEFINPELCAIGCSDGLIRIWDCLHWKLVKTLNTSSKSPLQALKNLLPKNHFSLSGDEIPCKDGHGRMRLLSTQADGSSLIWESEIFGNMILIGDEDPTGHMATTAAGMVCG